MSLAQQHSAAQPPEEAAAPLLFTPLQLRGLTLKNRVMLSPMAIYGAKDGFTSDLHLVHYGRFALGGVGLIFVENTAVTDEGRITHGCPGLWRDEQAENLKRITAFAHECGAAVGIQLSHCGRKGSSQRPWHGGMPLGEADLAAREELSWPIRASSSEPFDSGWPSPKELTVAEIDELVEDYRRATVRARDAGFDVVEMHCAHGYLLHSFLSPLANTRTDDYGGSLENRMRLPLRIAAAMRAEWPEDRPIFTRISSVDGINVGWSIDDSVAFARELKAVGVDVIDCSSGGMKLPRGQSLVSRTRGFQVPFAGRVRREVEIPTVAVGLIRDAEYAESVLAEGDSALIAIGREALFNPNWAVGAALELKGGSGWEDWQERYGWWLERRSIQQGDVFGRKAG